MNEYRKLLMRKIDHAFAQGKYPFFYGICGMGKHEALHGYAQRQKRACKATDSKGFFVPYCVTVGKKSGVPVSEVRNAACAVYI